MLFFQDIILLVLQQVCFDGYRVIQSVQGKDWVEGNGHSLVKTHHAGLDALAYSLRASQEAVIHVIALFVKGVTISCKVRQWLTASWLAVLIKTNLLEY